MPEEQSSMKGNPLLNVSRFSFFLVVDLIILILSRILGKEDASKFKKEFFGFMVQIARGRRIRWSKVLSDTLADQLSSMGTSKRFYINSYLVYLLLHGKYRPTTKDVSWVKKGKYAIWNCYPKWKIERRWNSFVIRNDGWEYLIYKEIKGEVAVAKISNSTQDALRKHGDFFI